MKSPHCNENQHIVTRGTWGFTVLQYWAFFQVYVFASFWLMVLCKRRSFTVLWYHLFALSCLIQVNTMCSVNNSRLNRLIKMITILCKCFFLFIGQEPATTWPANNCLRIMVCSCAMSFSYFWLQILFCSCINETMLFSFLWSRLHENGRLLRFPKIFLKEQTRWWPQTNHNILLNLIQ